MLSANLSKQFHQKIRQHAIVVAVTTLHPRGVRSLKFLTPLRLQNILKFWTPTPALTPKWII